MDTQTTDSKPKESARALLAEIIDYAGLFPPSQISMAEAVTNYAAYKNSNYKWMLGRFIVRRAARRLWNMPTICHGDAAKAGV